MVALLNKYIQVYNLIKSNLILFRCMDARKTAGTRIPADRSW